MISDEYIDGEADMMAIDQMRRDIDAIHRMSNAVVCLQVPYDNASIVGLLVKIDSCLHPTLERARKMDHTGVAIEKGEQS